MKIGVISDIHSNSIALKAVLQEFEKRNIEKIICCGDILGIGPRPEEAIQTLIKNKDKLIAVRGNHEQYLLKGLPKKIHDDKRFMEQQEIANHKWTHSQLSEESKEFLKSLPLQQSIKIQNKEIYIVHYPIDENGKFKKHIKNATLEENKEMFSNIDAEIYLYGHTHAVNINNENNKWYINPGTLGCPETNGIANCGIITIEDEKIEFEALKVEYDVEAVVKEIQTIKFPFYEKILKSFYGIK